MRTTKELLILLREFLPTNIAVSFRCGGSLCYSIIDMDEDDIITWSERELLLKYVEEHKPKRVKVTSEGFWWKYKSLPARMRFINKLISEL